MLAREEEERAQKAAPVQAAPKRERQHELRMSFKEKHDYETIDARMEQLQQELEEIDALTVKHASDFVKLTELAERREKTEQALCEAEERWLYLTDLAERIEAQKKG